MKRAILYLLLSGLFAGAPREALAAYQVRFVDGGSLEVRAVEREGDITVLTLKGGGTMGVRSSRISRVIGGPGEGAAGREGLPPVETGAEPRIPPSGAGADASVPLREGEELLMGAGETGGFSRLIRRAAASHGVDAELLRCVLLVESSFNPRAVSPKGARGLAQLMPGTARELGVDDPFDAGQSIDAAARLLGRLLEENRGRFVPALAAYNAGPGAVRRYGGVPPYGETIRYVEKVLSLYHARTGDPAGP